MGYVVSIVITMGTTEYLWPESGEQPFDHKLVSQYFGSLFETMYTLYKITAGGINWGDITVLLSGPGWAFEGIIILYTFFTIFAVINIVTGVFVDGAIELAKRDR